MPLRSIALVPDYTPASIQALKERKFATRIVGSLSLQIPKLVLALALNPLALMEAA